MATAGVGRSGCPLAHFGLPRLRGIKKRGGLTCYADISTSCVSSAKPLFVASQLFTILAILNPQCKMPGFRRNTSKPVKIIVVLIFMLIFVLGALVCSASSRLSPLGKDKPCLPLCK